MITPRKKIAYISGTRADFGLMTPVLRAIEKSSKLSLQIYAIGMHLMTQFGSTLDIVRKEFPSVKVIDAFFKGNTPAYTARFIAEMLSKVTDLFEKSRPDTVLLLGDRPEMLAVATVSVYLDIPTAHLHGGERTGTQDEIVRHAITKLSSLHFPATENAAERIRKMGEDEWRIHTVGAPALDVILQSQLPSKEETSAFINLSASERFALLVQHPGEDVGASGAEIEETLSALKKIAIPVVAVYPNADAGSRKIIEALEKERANPLFRIFKNIPYEMFLAVERDAAVWVGNSSAMMIESASFRTPCVNVGGRQNGRMRGDNVINVGYRREEIRAAVEKSLRDISYLAGVRRAQNPWGDGKTAKRIVRVLERLPLHEKLLAKQIAY